MCRRPFPPALIVTGPIRRRIVDAIANRPDGITINELMDVVYGDDPAGGPDTPNSLYVIIKHANEQLSDQGYQIKPAWRGRGAGYRLIKTGTAPSRSTMSAIDELFRGYCAAEQKILAARRGGR
jgi:hypothetical protein